MPRHFSKLIQMRNNNFANTDCVYKNRGYFQLYYLKQREN